jgi:hypothetical protein
MGDVARALMKPGADLGHDVWDEGDRMDPEFDDVIGHAPLQLGRNV